MSQIPSGLAGLAGQGVASVVGIPRYLADTARMAVDDDYRPWDVEGADFGEFAEHYFPIAETFRSSGASTGRRTSELAVSAVPGGLAPHETAYGDAVREGRIVDVLLEDVGNLSVVGGAAGRALSAGGAAAGSTRAVAMGNRLTDITRLGDRAGAAPAQVYVQGARALRPLSRQLDNAYQAVTGRPGIGEAARGAIDRNVFNAGPLDPNTVGPWRAAVEPARRAVAASRLNPTVRRAAQSLDGSRMDTDTAMLPAIQAAIDLEHLTPEAKIAAGIIDQGIAKQYAAAGELPTAEFNAFVARTFGDTTDITPEALRTAIDYEKGLLTGDVKAQLDDGVRVMGEIRANRTDNALQRDGESIEDFRARSGREFPLSREQLGTAPLTSAMDQTLNQRLGLRQDVIPGDVQAANRQAAVSLRSAADQARALADDAQRGTTVSGKLVERARVAERKARAAERTAARFDEKVGRLRDEIARSADAAPDRFRKNIRAYERGVKALEELAEEFPQSAALFAKIAEEVPGTLDDLVAAGIDPAHLIGGRVQPRSLKSLGAKKSGLPREGRTTTTRQAKGDVVEFSVENQLIQEALEAQRLAGRRAAQQFDGQYGTNAADVIPASELEGLSGANLRTKMAEYGYEAWNPRAILDIVPDDAINLDTRFLPQSLKQAFTYTIDTALPNAAWQLLATGNQKFKNALLPLSPTWYIGSTFGNALMTMIGQGIDPFTYTKGLVDEWRAFRRDGEANMPRRARTTGLTFQEGQVLSPANLTKRAPMKYGYGRQIRDRGFRVTETLDDVNKSVVYNHALEMAKSDPATRTSLKEVAVNDARRAVLDAETNLERYGDEIPDAQLARVERARAELARVEASDAPFAPEEYALRQALNVMGDYARMAPWERKMVQIMPFYRWARHITQLSLRMPFEHPARVAWTLHLAELGAPEEGELPSWLQGSIPMGGWLMPSRMLNPFGDIGSSEGGPLLNPDEFLRSVSPFIKVPIAALTGRNLGRGGDALTRPYGSGVVDPRTGREDQAPALVSLFPQNTRWSELANVAVSQLPLTRNLRDVATGTVGQARFDTGQRIMQNGRPLQSDNVYGPLAPLAQLANLPRPMSERDVAAARARFLENLARTRRTQQTYRES